MTDTHSPGSDLPTLALSVRQPWAWAIIFGGKTIENRSLGSIRAGRMVPGPIAIHAAAGMREEEYRWAVAKLQPRGITIPRPDALVRRAIIGQVRVTEIISKSDNPWFGGDHGLVLAEPFPFEPIPAAGALGYFEWAQSGTCAAPLPWMLSYGVPGGDSATLDLFPDAPQAFRNAPKGPGGRG
ncbi:MAG: hypothetical protein AAF580_06970 [Pseudomonadota bacterium]